METGTLETEPPADLLRRLAQQGVTGCLRLDHGDAEAAVWFRGGSVYTASAEGARARLGDRLVGAGHITEEQLATTLERQREMDERRRIGELLIEGGLIDHETMAAYVREQMADSVALALGWVDGRFTFTDGEETSEDVPLDVSVENLLMEGARRLGEWEVVQRRIGSLDAVVDFQASGGQAELSLTADEWSMLTRIDGVSSVREIAAESGYGEFDAARIIYGLLTAGVVVLVDEEPAVPPAPAEPEPQPEPQAAEPETETAESEPEPEPEREAAEPQGGSAIDRNELFREFAALDDDWGTSTPPAPPPPREPAEPPPPPATHRFSSPPPDTKPKRGLFGRRKRD